MFVLETIARIRFEHFQNRKGIKRIARELGVARDTVRKVLRSQATEFSYKRETQPLPMPPLTAAAVPAGTPAPPHAKITRIFVCAVFFGPFGALVGTGFGLLVSGLRGDFRPKANFGGSPPAENGPPP